MPRLFISPLAAAPTRCSRFNEMLQFSANVDVKEWHISNNLTLIFRSIKLSDFNEQFIIKKENFNTGFHAEFEVRKSDFHDSFFTIKTD